MTIDVYNSATPAEKTRLIHGSGRAAADYAQGPVGNLVIPTQTARRIVRPLRGPAVKIKRLDNVARSITFVAEREFATRAELHAFIRTHDDACPRDDTLLLIEDSAQMVFHDGVLDIQFAPRGVSLTITYTFTFGSIDLT